MRQSSFSENTFEKYHKKTRKERLLEEINQVRYSWCISYGEND